MSKICAKCDKPVYPLEELKCLDKIWHKGCFKCWECGMSLNMKNYKGFDRKPYCSAHYPQTKATVVADTPELQRLSQTSKLQSQAKYHEDFEKNIKGSKIQVADDPETQRLKQLSSVVSQVEYKGLREKVMDMEARRQSAAQPDVPEKSFHRPASGGPDDYANEGQKSSPYSERSVSHSVTYCADGKVESQPNQRKIGSIADYDPMNYSSTLPHSGLRQTQEWEETVVMSPSLNHPYQQYLIQQQQQLRPQLVQEQKQQQQQQPLQQTQLRQQQQHQQYNVPYQQPVQHVQRPSAVAGAIFQAMYDYDAQDDDEVSFVENDLVINCDPIDEGWMFGTIKRTGRRGMLPANYVERVQ